MRIGIIGSGNVGRTIADGALRAGHEVRLGAREPERTCSATGWTVPERARA